MKNIFKRISGMLLVLAISISMSTQAFAQEIGSNKVSQSTLVAENSSISARGIWGGEATGEGWSSGTFNVYLPNFILRAGMTLKTECSNPSSNGGGVFFYVYDPKGNLVTNDETLGLNDEDNTLKIWNANAGYYKVEYVIIGPAAVHMYCWIYG